MRPRKNKAPGARRSDTRWSCFRKLAHALIIGIRRGIPGGSIPRYAIAKASGTRDAFFYYLCPSSFPLVVWPVSLRDSE